MELTNKQLEELMMLATTQDRGTGMTQQMQQLLLAPGRMEDKMKAMFDIFESTKPHWPPMSKDGSVVPACKKGCAYCCHLNVDLLKPEMNYIWNKVTKYLTDEQIASVKAQAAANYKVKKELKYEKRLETRLACPFLDKTTSTCMIYEDRPISCRGMYSGDLKACENGMKGSNTNLFWAAPFFVSDDMALGGAIALIRLQGRERVTTTLEVGILLEDNPNTEEYGR